MLGRSIVLAAAVASVSAHIGLYAPSMYCLNGYSNQDQENNNEVSNPLYNLSFSDFWFHGDCKNYPPPEGVFTELPAGGKVSLELAGNRGQTSLSFNGQYTGVWPDGKDHSNYDDPSWNNTCIWDPNLHTENRTRAAGTVLAIAYQSDIHQVKYEDLVIISVAPNTPWYRLAEYEIPADLPGCDDCVCAYSWIPNHCGIPNMYMNGFKCKVTNARPDAPKLAKAQKAVWCEGQPDKCTQGAKGITIMNQQPDANTISFSGMYQADGQEPSPGYNEKMGFKAGAQNDIFESAPGPPDPAPQPTESSTDVPVPQPTSTDAPVPEPTSTDAPVSEPTSTDAPAPQPTSTDVPAPQPTSTDVPAPQPTESSTNAPEPPHSETPAPGHPKPTESCSFPHSPHSHRPHRGHHRHQRRLASFAGFHLSMDM